MKRLHVSRYPYFVAISPNTLLQVVLKAIMLRRKKTDMLNGKPLLELPKRLLTIVPCEFDPEERAFYVGLEQRIEAVMQKLAKSGDLSKSYTSVLVLLLRLRQGKKRAFDL